ncbi:ABC transporter permease [Pseudonocardia petroleophila]|uniref:Transport permease protein n=1 Tax=Pseudonocardia petroleophila TaxID=37331 RepID=A0A7G7MI26_9PSEU|nr:ABC transporter permease [Pseudonocardia petroleophila]QNG52437.1 ABC transporter permease [Pseudonocardia petroleophila]
MTAHVLTDSATMLRRNLLHMRRYPSLTLMLAGMPIVFLLLFVFVLGGTLEAGIGRSYVDYVVPGVLLMTVAASAQGTAISVAMDMAEGIVARFRTMSIARASVLTGHVVGSLVQTLFSTVLVVLVALLIGFRPTTGPLSWLAALGVFVLITFAVTWLAVALGMVTDSVETASNLPMPLVLLPFLGSGFVPTDSMPTALRWFAEVQPFTPFIETLRGLLMGTPIGGSGWAALGWCAVIALGGYLWARRLYTRDPSRT